MPVSNPREVGFGKRNDANAMRVVKISNADDGDFSTKQVEAFIANAGSFDVRD